MSELAPEHLIYDPAEVFTEVFSNPVLACDMADVLDCREVNSLVGFLEDQGRSGIARVWLARHLSDCDDPPRHLH
ncbi:hypothetical protein NQK81_01305 [Amycolatopsis roodepoortensis]|uniref:hypothetical protein n=1 Tax=Amycolatopsis roodepoortensis TaxID=700274 RepID=UPI00214BEAA2|nr:hypothetical protein [Amycolatopsis roodepoortensis]UUV32112.1 hypothetical protein NQK81_01305 [Amycolatopsis roodepoortensis]